MELESAMGVNGQLTGHQNRAPLGSLLDDLEGASQLPSICRD